MGRSPKRRVPAFEDKAHLLYYRDYTRPPDEWGASRVAPTLLPPFPPIKVKAVDVPANKKGRFHLLMLQALVKGLLRRLVHLDPREDWIQKALGSSRWMYAMAGGFHFCAEEYGEEGACEILTDYFAQKKTPRKNAVVCDPLTMCDHYNWAAESVRSLAALYKKRWEDPQRRIPTLQSEGKKWIEGLYKCLETPGYQCVCIRRTTLPIDFDTWIVKRGRTQRDLILYALAHYHDISIASVRHLIDKGNRLMKSTPRRKRSRLS